MTFPYNPIENSRIGLLEGEIKKKTRVSLVVLRHRVAFREKREREREETVFSRWLEQRLSFNTTEASVLGI